jgi:hypothetical protein
MIRVQVGLYTLYLIGIDFIINLIFNLIENSSQITIALLLILRPITIILIFPLSETISEKLFSENKLTIKSLLISKSFFILILPLVIYSFAENSQSVLESYKDVFGNYTVFKATILPFLCASIIMLVIGTLLKIIPQVSG